MIFHAARMRRWLLWAAPVMILGGLGRHAGGAGAALALWAAVGALPAQKTAYPYPRKRRLPFHRLFFSVAVSSFCHALLFKGILWLYPAALSSPAFLLPALVGAAGFSLPLGVLALSFRLPKGASLPLGGLFFVLSFLIA